MIREEHPTTLVMEITMKILPDRRKPVRYSPNPRPIGAVVRDYLDQLRQEVDRGTRRSL